MIGPAFWHSLHLHGAIKPCFNTHEALVADPPCQSCTCLPPHIYERCTTFGQCHIWDGTLMVWLYWERTGHGETHIGSGKPG